jgi:hypothetical protein
VIERTAMTAFARRWLTLLVIACGCHAPGVEFPPPPGTPIGTCAGATAGAACTGEMWCRTTAYCGVGAVCQCNAGAYQCFDVEDECELGEGASCLLEGSPQCNTPPAPGSCVCEGGQLRCERSCPLAECPDFDAASESCTCADGSCP